MSYAASGAVTNGVCPSGLVETGRKRETRYAGSTRRTYDSTLQVVLFFVGNLSCAAVGACFGGCVRLLYVFFVRNRSCDYYSVCIETLVAIDD